jgi:Tfp pilus assembly PilM family ATPase
VILSREARSPIGLDIGARAVKAVQLGRSRARTIIRAAAHFPRISPGEALNPAELIRALGILRRQGFVGERVVVCIPDAQLLSGVVELPARAPAPTLNAIARQELARACKKDPGSIELAWWELPAGGPNARADQGAQALALGCAHADSEQLLACFAPLGGAGRAGQGGLDVIAIDARPAAIARACAPLAADAPNLTAVLDLGHSAAHILIMAGRSLVYERTLAEASLRLLASGIANQLSIDDALAEYVLRVVGCGPTGRSDADTNPPHAVEQAEDARALICAHADALAGELRASMSYATRRFNGTLSRIVLCGHGADIPGLADRITRRTGAEAVIARADALVPGSTGPDPALLGPGAAVALGLALHDAPDASSGGGA